MKGLKQVVFIFVFSIGANNSFSQYYPDDCLDSLEVMNAFSPNSDGINDVFEVRFPCPPEKFEFTVFSRWGNEIYKTDNFKFQWNGKTKKGELLASEVYIYILKYTFNGREVELKGNFTLIW